MIFRKINYHRIKPNNLKKIFKPNIEKCNSQLPIIEYNSNKILTFNINENIIVRNHFNQSCIYFKYYNITCKSKDTCVCDNFKEPLNIYI